MIIRISEERLTPEEIISYVTQWNNSDEKKRLEIYKEYYESLNPDLVLKVNERASRGKTPNYFIPTAYYSTLVDTMAGYLFQNIQYIDKDGAEELLQVLEDNKAEIKDMTDGTHALVYNRAIEYVYTEGEANNLKYKFTPIDTSSVVLIYNQDIEPKLTSAIYIRQIPLDDVDYAVDVIYSDEFVTYHIKNESKDEATITEVPDSRKPLLFSEVPIVVYNTEIISQLSSFNSVIPYIKALDWLITGNTNELDRLVDALLVLGKKIKPEDLLHTEEWKTLENYSKDDRAEYLSKDMSPEFRKYVSELLIQEIHKHSHIIDWYSPDTGMSGAVSGKALKTRLFDMDMFSQRIEKVYRIGLEKRIKLLSELLGMAEKEQADIEIVFNRTVPSDLEDKIIALNQASFLSTQTKVIQSGFDWEVEQERLKEESIGMIDLDGIPALGDEDAMGITPTGVVLNGAQIQQVAAIASQVAKGELSRPEAIEIVMLLGIDRATAERVIPEQGEAEVVDLP